MKPEFFNPLRRRPVKSLNRMIACCLIILIPFIPALGQEDEEEDLNVFWKWLRWNNPGSFLTDYMISQADFYYDQRDKEISRLKTSEDWLKRQANARAKLQELIGPFPEKTELNPRITGVIQKEGYRIEKIIYESSPGFYVTGCLFVPEDHGTGPGKAGKAPAILNLIGHNQESFRAELYQILYLNLVKKGFIVLAIDPIGQGEMVQYFDPEIKFSSVGYSVVEHCYFGNICFISGVTPARYFAWDGIRGIDYLLTRDDVDPGRIGVTGFSGGGTITSYIAALDDRVKVAVPCSWSTASRRQIETKGAQDAESLFIGSVAQGITFEDLVEVRAPKPTLMTFTSRDEYLSIQGAREAYEEIRKVYQVFGKPENIRLVEDDDKHWMTPRIRNEIYAFFMEHLEVTGDPAEEEVQFLSQEELMVTPTGQVSTYLGGENITSLNKKETDILIQNLEESRKNIDDHRSKVKLKAKELSGFIQPQEGKLDPFFNGRYQRDSYTVAKYAIPGEGNYVIPLLLFVPDNPVGKLPGLVYLHPEGKAEEAKIGGEIEGLVKNGYIVVAPDVLGVGETADRAGRAYTGDYTAVLIGRSTVGVRAGDIVRVVSYMKQLETVDPGKIGVIGIEEMGIPVMHAAAFDPTMKHIALANSPISYRSIVMNKLYRIGLLEREGGGYWHPYEIEFPWGVAGALTAYDLPDLIGCMAPGKVAFISPQNHLLEPASEELITHEMNFPREVYKNMGMTENLKIISSEESLMPVVEWLFK
ncbi:MAG: acetylxylan esterase [Cyclobacteriaceae bacterium]|nr:acetylxylan esterase [Cyclobacteriaceae bacterium]